MYSLTTTWTLKPGKEKLAIAAIRRLAQQVKQHEAGTLIYLAHVPDMSQASMPTPSNLEVVFYEVYRNKAAFCAHVTGPYFQAFVAKYGDLFLSTKGECADPKSVGKPFSTIEFLELKAGFIRPNAMK